ncbi:MAG: HD domain-containing protein [SAR324 cluster bacterium]|nr:HD domain-containing protein [SAR324 cluster bacterium]
MTLLLTAIRFAAEKHQKQRRRDEVTPYINHPIEVATVLWSDGKVRESEMIAAAVLHDILEDTQTLSQEIQTLFGDKVLAWVEEVTDDKSLPKQERKRLQIVHAQSASPGAKQIKMADKICNLRDLMVRPPHDWTLDRKLQYLSWSDQVMDGLRGCNALLESLFDQVLQEARQHYRQTSPGMPL